MKTFKEFRREWVLDPSKEMIVEKEIISAYDRYKLNLLTIPDVICSPILAKIEHINGLGKSNWYEVVYYDDKWYSYSESKTFEDGEQVVKWKYAKDCL